MANEVVKAEPRSVLVDMSVRYGMEPDAFERTVRATCMPGNATREEFAALMLVAKEYRLSPITREIYAFPKKGGGIVPVVSVDGWVSLANSHPQIDGFTFEFNDDADGNPISCTCTMYRKDRSHPVVVTEYLNECIRPTEPWKMKRRMLRHKTLIQTTRYAFGFSGIFDHDEAERIAEGGDAIVQSPAKATPPAPPVSADKASAPKPPAGEVQDAEFTEVDQEADRAEKEAAKAKRENDALLAEAKAKEDAAAKDAERKAAEDKAATEAEQKHTPPTKEEMDAFSKSRKAIDELARKDLPFGVYLSELETIMSSVMTKSDFKMLWTQRRKPTTQEEKEKSVAFMNRHLDRLKEVESGAAKTQDQGGGSEEDFPTKVRRLAAQFVEAGDEANLMGLVDELSVEEEEGRLAKDVSTELRNLLIEALEQFG